MVVFDDQANLAALHAAYRVRFLDPHIQAIARRLAPLAKRAAEVQMRADQIAVRHYALRRPCRLGDEHG